MSATVASLVGGVSALAGIIVGFGLAWLIMRSHRE